MWLDRINHSHLLLPLGELQTVKLVLLWEDTLDFFDLLHTSKHLGCSDWGRVHYFRSIVCRDVPIERKRIIYTELERCAVNRTEQNRTSPEDGEKVGNEHIILPSSHAFLTLMEQKYAWFMMLCVAEEHKAVRWIQTFHSVTKRLFQSHNMWLSRRTSTGSTNRMLSDMVKHGDLWIRVKLIGLVWSDMLSHCTDLCKSENFWRKSLTPWP